MEEVVERLVSVQELADDAGYGDLVGFDFGLMPELDYYTGIVHRGVCPGSRFPGGQWRPLRRSARRLRLAHARRRLAVDLDRLHEALVDEGEGVTPVAPPPLSFAGGLDDRRAGNRAAPPGRRRRRPAGRRSPAAPRLASSDGEYVLETVAGTTRGSWREVLRALGAG